MKHCTFRIVGPVVEEGAPLPEMGARVWIVADSLPRAVPASVLVFVKTARGLLVEVEVYDEDAEMMEDWWTEDGSLPVDERIFFEAIPSPRPLPKDADEDNTVTERPRKRWWQR